MRKIVRSVGRRARLSERRSKLREQRANGLHAQDHGGRAASLATSGASSSPRAATLASAAALVATPESVRSGLRTAEVDYRRPASGAIVATARIDEEPSTALDQLAFDNRARVGVDVSLTDEADTQVAG